jgi:hypothetical protein
MEFSGNPTLSLSSAMPFVGCGRFTAAIWASTAACFSLSRKEVTGPLSPERPPSFLNTFSFAPENFSLFLVLISRGKSFSLPEEDHVRMAFQAFPDAPGAGSVFICRRSRRFGCNIWRPPSTSSPPSQTSPSRLIARRSPAPKHAS